MKVTLTIESDEGVEGLRNYIYANDYAIVINEVDNMIRNRLKYSEVPLSESECDFLEELRRNLYIEGPL